MLCLKFKKDYLFTYIQETVTGIFMNDTTTIRVSKKTAETLEHLREKLNAQNQFILLLTKGDKMSKTVK